MTPAAIIEAVTDRHGRIHLLDGDRLAVIPQSALDDTLRETIGREKRALVAYLRDEVRPASTVLPSPPPRDHRDSCDGTCDDDGDGSIGCNPLADAPTPPDPTPLPAPCLACGSLVYWRPFGDDRLQCQGCEPCPDASAAAWYGAAAANDPLAELLDPDARAALLWWYSQGHPEIADEEVGVLRRLENLGALPNVLADLMRLVDRVRELRDAHWRDRECGAA